jgi:hypothetical protein
MCLAKRTFKGTTSKTPTKSDKCHEDLFQPDYIYDMISGDDFVCIIMPTAPECRPASIPVTSPFGSQHPAATMAPPSALSANRQRHNDWINSMVSPCLAISRHGCNGTFFSNLCRKDGGFATHCNNIVTYPSTPRISTVQDHTSTQVYAGRFCRRHHQIPGFLGA